MKKLRMMLLLSLLSCLLFGMAVQAADTIEVKVPVSCKGENMKESFSVVLQDLYHDTESTLSLKAGEENYFTVALPKEPGKYSCRIYQKKGDDAGASYDDTVYRADIHLYYEEETMKSQVVVYPEGEDAKTPSASFSNKKEVTVVNVPGSPTSGTGSSKTNLEAVETPKTPLENLLITARQTFDENPVGFLIGAFIILCVFCGLFVCLVKERKGRKEDEAS